VTDRDPEDGQFRSVFAELREADEGAAPSFEDIVAGRASHNTRVKSYWSALAAAAGLVIATGIGYTWMAERSARLTVPNEVVALSSWRAPTDVLLETPGKTLLTNAPELGASLVDAGIIRRTQ
jgi:hypothetical protein